MKRLIAADPDFAGTVVKQRIPGHSREEGHRRAALLELAGASNAV
jgi:hypothetical protein